jgi:hypothetical protein
MSSLNNAPDIKPSSYQSPRIVTLGKAVKLIRESQCGPLKDGSQGWWYGPTS